MLAYILGIVGFFFILMAAGTVSLWWLIVHRLGLPPVWEARVLIGLPAALLCWGAVAEFCRERHPGNGEAGRAPASKRPTVIMRVEDLPPEVRGESPRR